MPRATTTDISLTKSYIPKVSKIPGISPTIAKFYKSIENHNIHEGRVVDQAYYKSNNIERLFTNIRFDCLFKINEPIVPRFILDFYSQVTVQTDEYGYLVISFMIQHEFITSSAQFETEGPYSTDLPTPDDIRRLLELERVMVDRTIKSQTVTLTPNQILTKELSPDMKQWEELIRENVFGLVMTRDQLAFLAHMVLDSSIIDKYMEANPHLNNVNYDIVERAAKPTLLSIFTPSSARHLINYYYDDDEDVDDDDDDVETSRASTPSPTTYLNSLNPLNYQNYQMPSSSEQTDETLFERQTTLLNQTQQMHKEMRGGFKSFGKALKGVFSKKKK
ncbi:hypothetical protein Tco_0839530 [Tanacetum coccineum]|uniref:Uncharacterized protein n=1 Tax=Tanacetum coccineum TaxID=301880 RepID=A0ABQ5AUT9_9ASTR